MKQRIVFEITCEDGSYTAVASGKNYGIITQGENFEELQKNIQEAVALYLEDDDGNKKEKPNAEVSLLANMKIPFPA